MKERALQLWNDPQFSLMTIHTRTGHELEFGGPNHIVAAVTQIDRTIGCAKYFAKFLPNPTRILFYIATDSKSALDKMQLEFGKNVTFFSDHPVTHSAFATVEELGQIVYDWWMLGEGDWMILTAASTFSEFAQYRQGNVSTQYIIGGKTTCEDKSSEYYLETARHWNEHIWPS